MNSPKIYIIVITVIALGIVGYIIYKSKTSATPSPTTFTYGPSPTPTQTVAPIYTPSSPTPMQTVTPPPAISSSDSKIKYDFSGGWKIATVNGENKSPVTLSAGQYVGPAGVYSTAPPYEWVFYRSGNSTDLSAVDVQYGGGSLVINIRPDVNSNGRSGTFFKIYKTADGIVQFFGAPKTGYFFARDDTYKSIWSDPNYSGN